MSVQEFLIALGGNLPRGEIGPEQTLLQALDRLASSGARVDAVSRFFRTPAYPAGSGPEFVNAAARLFAEGGPAELMKMLHDAEAGLGRERRDRWAPRSVDLDLLAAGDTVLPDAATQTRWRDLTPERQMQDVPDGLILPHPRLQDRAFVLVPLNDIAPDWRHPLTGLRVDQMLRTLPAGDVDAITPV
ncbi:MAG: 2-amino-4-hydroxy-6-hydroxymethyldihydropteridine diphosphokinase [Pseudomonadota bacterium]